MAPRRGNVLFITVIMAGDCLPLSAIRCSRRPHSTAWPARRGVLFANHSANAVVRPLPRLPLHRHLPASQSSGAGRDAVHSRFTDTALLAREIGYDPVLFGHRTAADPRTVPPGDPALYTYEGVLPGFRSVLHDPWRKAACADWEMVGRTRI